MGTGAGADANQTWVAITTATSAVFDYGKHHLALPVYNHTAFLFAGPYCFWVHLALVGFLIWMCLRQCKPRHVSALPPDTSWRSVRARKRTRRPTKWESSTVRKRVRFQTSDVPMPELQSHHDAYSPADEPVGREDDTGYVLDATDSFSSSDSEDDMDGNNILLPDSVRRSRRGWCGCCRRFSHIHHKEI